VKLHIVRATLMSVVAVLTVLTALAQTPGPFSADLKTTLPQGTDISGKIYFNGAKVRVETTTVSREGAEGRPAAGPRAGSILIADPSQKVSYVVMPQQHMYMEMHSDQLIRRRNFDWKMYDRSNPCATEPDTNCKKVGADILNGRNCDRWEFARANAGGTSTVWIDQKTGIPIKRQMAEGVVVELSNIQEGPQPDSLFEVPPGYQKMEAGAMPRGMPPSK